MVLSEATHAKLEQALAGGGSGHSAVDAVISAALDLLLASRGTGKGAQGEPSPDIRLPHSELAALPSCGVLAAQPAAGSRQSCWEALPYTVAEALHRAVAASAPPQAQARLLTVCRTWSVQFAEFITEAPAGAGIANRRCSWGLLGPGPGTTARLPSLRALSLGVRKLPAPGLGPICAGLPRLARLDLHFPPTFHPREAEHLGQLAALGCPSLGLAFRSFGVPHEQVAALAALPSLRRLAYKIHRSQSHQAALRGHAAALGKLTQLQELSLRVSFEGFLPARFGCLSILSCIPALTALTVRGSPRTLATTHPPVTLRQTPHGINKRSMYRWRMCRSSTYVFMCQS